MASSVESASNDAKSTTIFNWANKDGEFRRQVSSFREHISTDPDAKFKPEAGRYHLYVSYACPWAHRTLIVRALKGLEDIISVSVVDYLLGPDGWHFSSSDETPGCIPDTINHAQFLKEIYFKANPCYSARFTVPVLWDKKLDTIVNNESSEIIRMFNTMFDAYSSCPGVTFYPEHLKAEIDAINEWVYDQINNGVYKAGFATAQEAYEKNCARVFEGLDHVESILASNKYLLGNTFTEADIRLFTTILRFDPVYHGHFKCNLKTISANYPNILRWLRQVYQLPRVAETCNMTHIKRHYYMSHVQINPTRIVPLWDGPDLSVKTE